MMDKRDNVILLMLDLSAAFDTINHELLLRKMRSNFKITGTVLKWLHSYLSNRTFKNTLVGEAIIQDDGP